MMLIPFFEPRSMLPATQTDGNKVIHSRLKYFENQREHQGISIKYVVKGTEYYELEGESFRVQEGQFLLVNHGRRLATRINSQEPVEGLCIYFSLPLIRSVMEQHAKNPDLLEESHAGRENRLPRLLETVYPAQGSLFGEKISQVAQQLVANGNRPREMDPAFYLELATDLLIDQGEVQRALGRLSCSKASTQNELYRRLCLARAYMHDHLQHEIDLEAVSREACLSKFHFIRLFKEAFHLTPHQYLIKLRLRHAQALLERTSLSLADICQEVGLKDVSSFGRRFKREVGMSPIQYRKAVRA
jgi:AraC family transcriptional regulator